MSQILSMSTLAGEAPTDPYLWLEDVDAPRALTWVDAQNQTTLGRLGSDPRYANAYAQIRAIALATDRLALPNQIIGQFAYNFWQDAQAVRGILRRMPVTDLAAGRTQWETVIDLDALASAQKENWVWGGMECHSESQLCMVHLSRGGGDASVGLEFDLTNKTWVSGGFSIPEAKFGEVWLDRDTLLIGTDFGSGTQTDAGYPNTVRVWKRGQPLAQSVQIFAGQTSDVGSWPMTLHYGSKDYALITRSPTFFTTEYWLLGADQKTLTKLMIPDDASLLGVFEGSAFLSLRSDWKIGAKTFAQGSVVAIRDDFDVSTVEAVFIPTARSSFASLAVTKTGVLLSILENVQGKILQLSRDANGAWKLMDLGLPQFGSVGIIASSSDHETAFATYTSFLQPTTLYSVSAATQGSGSGSAQVQAVVSAPSRFKGARFKVEQFESVSSDGTKIPYYVVSDKNLKLDGSTPTLLYGYGGFEISMDPTYMGSRGKTWLEAGGAYVLANIRGGGEFGPAWHQAALKEHRQLAFDDFISVAEDLIARKITSPRRLGIHGGSNGGLLVGAVMTQRPDLLNAVICEVPLLDMFRYHLLLAGSSWSGEYGTVDDPWMEPVIAAYSPYQNIKPSSVYPEGLFMTSTRDDRVHPGHARKMVARLQEQGHAALLYENTEGGHAGAANIEQSIKKAALQTIYLYQKLVD